MDLLCVRVCRHAFTGHSCLCITYTRIVIRYECVSVYTNDMHGLGFYVLWDIYGNVCIHVFICIYMCLCTCVHCMLSAVSQCARRGPVYLVFITKPFTEAPIRIKPLSAHTDNRTQPASTRV